MMLGFELIPHTNFLLKVGREALLFNVNLIKGSGYDRETYLPLIETVVNFIKKLEQ